MPASSSEANPPRPFRRDDVGVSEVIGFLLTFGIISMILLVAMLGFNNAQKNAEQRLIEIQGSGAAQRVAAAAVDVALFAQDNPYEIAIALDLPSELEGISYNVFLCQDGTLCECPPTEAPPCASRSGWCAVNDCPYVKVSSSRGTAQYQSTFLLAGKDFCDPPYNVASGGVVLVTYHPSTSSTGPTDCIGLQDEAL